MAGELPARDSALARRTFRPRPPAGGHRAALALLTASAVLLAVLGGSRFAGRAAVADGAVAVVGRPGRSAPRPLLARDSARLAWDDRVLQAALTQGDEDAIARELRQRLGAGLTAALASLDRLPGADGRRTDDLSCRLVRLFVASDPANAPEALRVAYGGALPPAIVDTCYGALAALRPAPELAAAIAALPPGAEQCGAARQLLDRWAREAPDAALAWSRGHREALDDDAVGALVAAAAGAAPRAALEYLLGQAGTFTHAIHWEMQVSDSVARNATPANALELLVWAADLPLGETAWNNLVKQLFARVRDTDPATALGFAGAVRDPHLRDELIGASARAGWVADYGAAHGALALAALFEDPGHKSAAVARCMETLAARDAGLAETFLRGLPAGALKEAVHPALAAASRTDPAAAPAAGGGLTGPAGGSP